MVITSLMVQDNITVLCQERKVQKLVSCLSTCIFPDRISYPINEGSLHMGPPHPSNEGYSFAKRMVDVQNRLYRAQYGYNFTSVRGDDSSILACWEPTRKLMQSGLVQLQVIPTNVYGKHDSFSLQNGHVIPSLIHKCYIANKTDQDFVVLGSGRPLRQFIFSKDLAKLLIWALREYPEPTPIILSNMEEISIAAVAKAIADAFHFTDKIRFDASQSDGQHQKTVSNQKLLSYLPKFAFTPVCDALQETVQWFVENVNQARK